MRAKDEDLKSFLSLSMEEIVPVCVDTMKEGAEFILDITERATAFLNFYIIAIKRCEKESAKIEDLPA